MTNAIDNFDRNNPGLNARYITQSFLESPEHKYFLQIREKNDLNAEYQYNPNTRIYDFLTYCSIIKVIHFKL